MCLRASTLKSLEGGLDEEFLYKGTHASARYHLSHADCGKFDGRRALREAEDELARRAREERAEHERLRAYRQVHSLPSATPPPKRRPFMETAPFVPDAELNAQLKALKLERPYGALSKTVPCLHALDEDLCEELAGRCRRVTHSTRSM